MEMEIIKKISHMSFLIAGPDVKLARKKSALYKKEDESKKLRILEKRKMKKDKRKDNVIPKVRTINLYISISYLYNVSPASVPPSVTSP